MPLLGDSDGIGAGTSVEGITTDQRGMIRGDVVDIGADQVVLQVESASATVDTTVAGLTLPGAVSLANQYADSVIVFDPEVFGSPEQTITLTSTLDLTNTAGPRRSSAGPPGSPSAAAMPSRYSTSPRGSPPRSRA